MFRGTGSIMQNIPHIQSIMELKTYHFNKQKRTNLETKLLKIRHMSRSKFFYLGKLISVSNPSFSNLCGLPF